LRPAAGASATDPVAAAGQVVARLHGHLLALAEDASPQPGAREQLVDAGADLLVAVGEVLATDEWRDVGHEALVDALTQREELVRAGEATYVITHDDISAAAARVREALASATSHATAGNGDLARASILLAALIATVCANLDTQDGHTAEQRRPATGKRLLVATRGVVGEVIDSARALTPLGDGDAVGTALTRALLLRFPQSAMAESDDSGPSSEQLDLIRAIWLRIASLTWVAASAIEGELDRLPYQRRFASMSDAVAEGAVNVLERAWLPAPGRHFAHRRAWSAQAHALTTALAVYIDGLRGTQGCLERTHLIVLTRLTRSVAAIAAVDHARDQLQRKE